MMKHFPWGYCQGKGRHKELKSLQVQEDWKIYIGPVDSYPSTMNGYKRRSFERTEGVKWKDKGSYRGARAWDCTRTEKRKKIQEVILTPVSLLRRQWMDKREYCCVLSPTSWLISSVKHQFRSIRSLGLEWPPAASTKKGPIFAFCQDASSSLDEDRGECEHCKNPATRSSFEICCLSSGVLREVLIYNPCVLCLFLTRSWDYWASKFRSLKVPVIQLRRWYLSIHIGHKTQQEA